MNISILKLKTENLNFKYFFDLSREKIEYILITLITKFAILFSDKIHFLINFEAYLNVGLKKTILFQKSNNHKSDQFSPII